MAFFPFTGLTSLQGSVGPLEAMTVPSIDCSHALRTKESASVEIHALRTPLIHNGEHIKSLHREGVEQPDMTKWATSKQDKAKLGEMYATGLPPRAASTYTSLTQAC